MPAQNKSDLLPRWWDFSRESEDLLEELIPIIAQAQTGDAEAYDLLVRRFQGMAIAYAYSVLGDVEAAEDAAQEAFLEAFECLPGLREPLAFSSWLRRIIWKQCDRISRRKQLERVPLELVEEDLLHDEETHHIAEQEETKRQVRLAVVALPESERLVTLLFYMGHHSQKNIAEFLEIPLSTVKKRLSTSRQKLRHKLSNLMQEDLKSHLPTPDPQFAERVKSFTSQFSQMIDDGQSLVYSLWVLAQKPGNSHLEAALSQVQKDVQDGDTLSEAMSKHPQLFDPAYLTKIRQGETNGNLKWVLRQLREL